jgi:hypothetical protein
MDSVAALASNTLRHFSLRQYLIAYIQKRVQHHFDTQLAQLRSAFRESEERLKSELRDRDNEIGRLRDMVFPAGSRDRPWSTSDGSRPLTASGPPLSLSRGIRRLRA